MSDTGFKAGWGNTKSRLVLLAPDSAHWFSEALERDLVIWEDNWKAVCELELRALPPAVEKIRFCVPWPTGSRAEVIPDPGTRAIGSLESVTWSDGHDSGCEVMLSQIPAGTAWIRIVLEWEAGW